MNESNERDYLKYLPFVLAHVMDKFNIKPQEVNLLLLLHGDGQFTINRITELKRRFLNTSIRHTAFIEKFLTPIHHTKRHKFLNAQTYIFNSTAHTIIQYLYDVLEGKVIAMSPTPKLKKELEHEKTTYDNLCSETVEYRSIDNKLDQLRMIKDLRERNPETTKQKEMSRKFIHKVNDDKKTKAREISEINQLLRERDLMRQNLGFNNSGLEQTYSIKLKD